MAALIMESVYGHRIVSLDDPYIDLIDRAMDAQNSTQFTGSILVDFFPFCAFHFIFVMRNTILDVVCSEVDTRVVARNGVEAIRSPCKSPDQRSQD